MSTLHLTALVLRSGDPSMCEYDFKGNKLAPYVEITFNAAPGFTSAALKGSLTKAQSGVKAVPGLADAAFTWTATPGFGLTFLSGGTICSIFTTVPAASAGGIVLAQAIIGG